VIDPQLLLKKNNLKATSPYANGLKIWETMKREGVLKSKDQGGGVKGWTVFQNQACINLGKEFSFKCSAKGETSDDKGD